MAVFTKPVGEKKLHKFGETLKSSACFPHEDAEVGAGYGHDEAPYVLLRSRTGRASSVTIACLLLTAFLLTSGILGGFYLYRQFAHSRMDGMRDWCHLHGRDNKVCDQIRSDEKNEQSATLEYDKLIPECEQLRELRADNFLSEDSDGDNGSENISGLNYERSRSIRFVHDFHVNKTGIVDEEGRRCFVMALIRTPVLPSYKLIDLFHNLWYYDVDIHTVRETMHVMLPPIKDRHSVGMYIERKCAGYPIYRLEKVGSGMYNRNVAADPTVSHFSGKNLELYIDNMDQLIDYEGGHTQHT